MKFTGVRHSAARRMRTSQLAASLSRDGEAEVAKTHAVLTNRVRSRAALSRKPDLSVLRKVIPKEPRRRNLADAAVVLFLPGDGDVVR
jgi:hypothetical protein